MIRTFRHVRMADRARIYATQCARRRPPSTHPGPTGRQAQPGQQQGLRSAVALLGPTSPVSTRPLRTSPVPDEGIDALAERAASEATRNVSDAGLEEYPEMVYSMVAVGAAAYALDGFYGSIKPLVNPPRSRGKRSRQILEALKLGFRIGSHAPRWQGELDWLFETRDSSVHHAEDFRPVVVSRTTEKTILAGGPECFSFSAESAGRAALLTFEIVRSCLERPKAATKAWAMERKGSFDVIAARAATGRPIRLIGGNQRSKRA